MTDQTDVEPGQLWVDNDPRNDGTRFVMVTAVDDTHATCETWYEHKGGSSRTVRIRRDRFRANASGYRRAHPAECDRQGVAP